MLCVFLGVPTVKIEGPSPPYYSGTSISFSCDVVNSGKSAVTSVSWFKGGAVYDTGRIDNVLR